MNYFEKKNEYFKKVFWWNRLVNTQKTQVARINYFISIINDDEGKPSELKSVAVGVSVHA